jgi:hypothetical protein
VLADECATELKTAKCKPNIGTQMTRILQIYRDVSFLGYTFGYIRIQMDVRILRISQIHTDFFLFFCLKPSIGVKKNPYQSVKSVKSVHPFVSQCIQKCNLKMKHPCKSVKSVSSVFQFAS